MSLSPSYTRKKGLQPTDNEKNKTCVYLFSNDDGDAEDDVL